MLVFIFLHPISPKLTGENNDKDDGYIDEKELEISQVTENLRGAKRDLHCMNQFTAFPMNLTGRGTIRVRKYDSRGSW